MEESRDVQGWKARASSLGERTEVRAVQKQFANFELRDELQASIDGVRVKAVELATKRVQHARQTLDRDTPERQNLKPFTVDLQQGVMI
jgi:hypothetical protein